MLSKKELGDDYDLLPTEFTVDMLFGGMLAEPDDDSVDLDFEQVWNILKKPHEDFTSVYEDIINTFPSKKDGIDNIFINHGFFIESSQGNGEWNKWEPFQDKDKNSLVLAEPR